MATTTYFPLEGTLQEDIRALLALSDRQGQSVRGRERDWRAAAVKVTLGLKLSLANDGDLQLTEN